MGTVLDLETARAAILAGAKFIVSLLLNLEVIKLAHRYDRAVFPGVFTLTELLAAWERGANILKVFSATALGPKYLKDIRCPLPQVKLTPTSGVNLQNIAYFIGAGASSCVGVRTAILNKKNNR